MTLGPTLVKNCPGCGQLIEEVTVMSTNNSGAVYWTDGEYFALMDPPLPELVKCPCCAGMVWLQELEVLGMKGNRLWAGALDQLRKQRLAEDEGCDTGEKGRKIEDFVGSLPFNNLEVGDYFAMLKKGNFDLEKTLFLRLKAWRAGNDIRRTSSEYPKLFEMAEDIKKPPLSDKEVENMKALTAMLGEKKHQERLLKAEIMRELGCFKQAMVLLDCSFKLELKNFANFIRKLAEKKDSWVRELIN
jgi:hypothetical protein